ncbi:MAG: tryptophan--tRNA ligase [Candidatus Pacebacteria bacterium]|jgi:tryptophanyl-tRNA synthetase|nr:tryptophan--tRNA ligase [bacterium]MDP6527755.1 tryptophan--tRNA ligase [Candidatus Paceibacterota bacterium]MDP6659592.1 tryptophan--tRNA ligase [Candidatus Paceibacterota bacterium]|tara:strand:- start:25118 stop:26071 length:954 start_codon:yes stop_codon:yes gene_type:complete
MASKKRLVSGIKPTGDLHLGNYFGAMRQFLDYQEEYESHLFIADYHALTTAYEPEKLRESIYRVAAGYIAIGIDPKKVTLYKQSDISEHSELAWVFNCITTMPFLMRAHAFKDAEAKNKEISVGTFDYPMLMAADILIYGADVVPVGKDQQQHIEIARDTAEKFNSRYGQTFKLPEALIREEVATVPGVDGQKMSKSYKNTIPLFGSKDEVANAVMGIVTDSDGEFPEYVYEIHKLFRGEDELKPLYGENKSNYKALKEALIADAEKVLSPMREKYNALLSDKAELEKTLVAGSEKVKELASEKMMDVRKKVGVSLN